ncbi:MAG: maleylpyruvate isomerase family mycothiol-dependent enzyme [Dermatophilaceae bacterium]
MSEDIWPTVHRERAALAADLAGLAETQWSTPSLCAGWTVRDVLAHMSATAAMTPVGFLAGFARSGFRFARVSEAGIAGALGDSPAETLRTFNSRVNASTSPPGPKVSWLGEAIIHSEDIRRPLGLTHEHSPDVLTKVADFYRDSNLLIGAKKRIEGLRLDATDSSFGTGEGPSVRGPVLALLMAMTGRGVFCDDLEGAGVETLRSRC